VRLVLTGLASVATMALTIVGVSSASASSSSHASAGTSWTVYHGDVGGSGLSTTVRAVTTARRAWTSPVLRGELYGEPLVSAGDVFVATEDDVVYALSSTNGRVIWSRHVASAVPSSKLPCGNISPSVGITGTPVIDTTRSEIFVVADELVHGRPEHKLVGLSTTSGRVELTQDVDPPGADPAALLQRTGLTLDASQVVFSMGGNYGDCAAYRGRVVAVNEGGSRPRYFTVDDKAGDDQGAIWMGGAAPVVDAKGNVYVAVGNGSVHDTGQAFDDSDSLLELSSTLHLEQYFAPSSWAQDNANDLDMSMAPALLSDGEVLLAGKARIVYLLNGAHLGGIGGQQATLASVCSNDVDGGVAIVGTTVYLPCLSGTVAVRVSTAPPALRVLWSATVGGGPPIVAAGLVWTIGSNGELYGLNPANGQPRQEASVGANANDFATPSVGDGLMLATSADRVVAFHAVASG
jgi:outer membrane protein assembly factor BamB